MVYLFLGEGFEEVEALCPLDLLRRAGVEVKSVGVGGMHVRGSHGIEVTCDCTTEQINLDRSLEMIILPGGMPGTTNLAADETVRRAISYAAQQGILIAAICAAPMILGQMGLLEGRTAVCYPGFEKYLTGAEISQKSVVVDDTYITAKGMGVAHAFGLRLVSLLCGEQAADDLSRGVCMPQ